MQSYRIEGIILHAFSFQDFDQILTVFTSEGIHKFLVKGAFSRKNGKGTLTAPLSHAEFVFRPGKGDLLSCREISMLNQHLNLRQNLELLESSFDLIDAIYRSQMPNKPAPALYKLLVAYLEKIPLLKPPQLLSVSFRLKVLNHEGLLSLASQCGHCNKPLHTHYLYGGESFCSQHALPTSLEFSKEEISLLKNLAYAQTFTQLAALSLPLHLPHKVKLLFKELL